MTRSAEHSCIFDDSQQDVSIADRLGRLLGNIVEPTWPLKDVGLFAVTEVCL